MVEYFTDFKPTQPLRGTRTLRGFILMFGFGNKLLIDKKGEKCGNLDSAGTEYLYGNEP